jgi:hypothetical protein
MGDRQAGALLIDAVLGITVLTVGILSFLLAVQKTFRATSDVGVEDQAGAAIENAVEALKAADFATLYQTRGARLPALALIAPDGSPAAVDVQFDVDETALPPQYGPLFDIDGDGSNGTRDASGHYVLLPARLTLNYLMSYGPERKALYVVLAED